MFSSRFCTDEVFDHVSFCVFIKCEFCHVSLTGPGRSPASPCPRCLRGSSWPGCLRARPGAGSSLCPPASPGVRSARTRPWHTHTHRVDKDSGRQMLDLVHVEESGEVKPWLQRSLHPPDSQPGSTQGFGCAARGDQSQTRIQQLLSEVQESGLIRDTEESCRRHDTHL